MSTWLYRLDEASCIAQCVLPFALLWLGQTLTAAWWPRPN